MKTYTYCFNQLRELPEDNSSRLFLSYKDLLANVGPFELERYFTADHGTIKAGCPEDACDRLFFRYNFPQADRHYTGRSMSLSDVIELWDNSGQQPVKTGWYCDRSGFVQVE